MTKYPFSIHPTHILLSVLVLLYYICIIAFASLPDYPSDLSCIWSGARMFLGNNSIVQLCELTPDNVSGTRILKAYPPWTWTYISWIGIPCLSNFLLYFRILTALVISVGVFLLLQIYKKEFRISCLEGAAILIFATINIPIFNLLTIGQITALQLFCYIIFLSQITKHRDTRSLFIAGLFLSIVAIKPPIILLIIFFLVTSALYNSIARKLLSGLIIGIALASVIAMSIRHDIWMLFLSTQLKEIFVFRQPNLAGALVYYFPLYPILLPIIIAAQHLLISKHPLFMRIPYATLIILWLMPLGLLLGPYSNVYDSLLLLPSILYMILYWEKQLSKRKFAVVMLACSVILLSGSIWYIRHDQLQNFIWYPLYIFTCSVITLVNIGKQQKKVFTEKQMSTNDSILVEAFFRTR